MLVDGGARFDLIVMDEIFERVPGEKLMRGSECTRQLRTAGVQTPVIACSGNVSGAESEKLFLEAGADLVWGKPFPDFTDGSMQRDIAMLLQHRDRTSSKGTQPES